MPKNHLFFYYPLILMLSACTVGHHQEVKIQNNSNSTFEIWKPDTTGYTLAYSVPPGAYILEDYFVKGKAKDHIGYAPSNLPFDIFDSLSFEGKSLTKDWNNEENWTSFLTGSRKKNLFLQFEFSDQDLN